MRESVEPVARRIFCGWLGVGAEGGDRARARMAEVCAVKRKVSEKVAASVAGRVAVIPWRMRS